MRMNRYLKQRFSIYPKYSHSVYLYLPYTSSLPPPALLFWAIIAHLPRVALVLLVQRCWMKPLAGSLILLASMNSTGKRCDADDPLGEGRWDKTAGEVARGRSFWTRLWSYRPDIGGSSISPRNSVGKWTRFSK